MDFLQEFIAEAKQVLKDLEHSLLELEKSPDPEQLNHVYRYLHTLKGSAGMFGYEHVERLAHELEDLFSDVRDGLRQQDDFMLDLTLHAVDVFRDLLDSKDVVKESEKIIESIAAIKGSAASGRGVVQVAQSLKGYVIILKPEENIYKRGINFQGILDDLQELGPCEFIIHNETTPFEKQLAEKRITSWFEVILATSGSLESVKDVFLFMKASEYHVFAITSLNVFSTAEYQAFISLSEEKVNERERMLTQFVPALAEVEDARPTRAEFEATTDDAEDELTEPQSIRKSKRNGHVSVSTQKLDQLINIVSELVIFRSEIQHLIGENQRPEITEAMEKLESLTLKLRDSAFNIRLVPLNVLNVKLQRLIRSVSKDLGKEVEFITDGLDTELDRGMINALEAPLMHIIRNAIDHGIETPDERERRNKPRKGLLKFYSYNSGDHVFIQLQDDGNGIDFDKIKTKGVEKGLLNKGQQYSEKELLNVMMTPGFSTADKVTTVSGRGVGMDVVKKEIAAIRGDVEVSTEKGLGSIFTLRLPLTLTVLDTLVVNVNASKYLIPISEVEFCYTERYSKLFAKKSRQLKYDEQLLPFVSLREYFGEESYPEEGTVIIINKNDTRMAVVVDEIVGKLQTVYKPLNSILQDVNCFSGASILGDGSMALILNALKLNQ